MPPNAFSQFHANTHLKAIGRFGVAFDPLNSGLTPSLNTTMANFDRSNLEPLTDNRPVMRQIGLPLNREFTKLEEYGRLSDESTILRFSETFGFRHRPLMPLDDLLAVTRELFLCPKASRSGLARPAPPWCRQSAQAHAGEPQAPVPSLQGVRAWVCAHRCEIPAADAG
jgi:hypothetical protein